MADRYFLDVPVAGDSVTLAGPEAHHLLGVMRAKVGDQVVLFDGTGHEYVAQIDRAGKRDAVLTVLSRYVADRELRREITLCAALPRGDRQRRLIEEAVELGVARFVPLQTKRGVVQPDDGVCERLRRMVVEATKQCGRNRLMEIAKPTACPPPADVVPAGSLKLLAHPGSTVTPAQAAAETMLSPTTPAAFLIGPEGGFTDDEAAAAAAAGWQAVDLGPRILRIETAAAALTAWLSLGEEPPPVS